MGEKELEFTEEDIDACDWHYHKAYFIQVLNGESTVEEMRENLRSLIGSQFDKRVTNNSET